MESQLKKVMQIRNRKVTTIRTIPKIKPDAIICGNEKGTCLLTGIKISEQRSVPKK
jgi:hypothetical protein